MKRKMNSKKQPPNKKMAAMSPMFPRKGEDKKAARKSAAREKRLEKVAV